MSSTMITEMLWVEKYRPKTLEEMVLDDNLKTKVKHWLKDPVSSLPNLILVGPPGCGKTTLANIIVRSIVGDKSDYLYVNGSAERGLQTIRDSVLEFMRYEPTALSPIKILFIDEADNLTPDAFKALRSSMESYQKHCRVLMTGNFDTFPEPIQSRCTVVRFQSLPHSVIIDKLTEILDREQVSYTHEDLHKLVSYFYPDMRKIVNYAQLISRKGYLDVGDLETLLDEKQMLVNELWNFMMSPPTRSSTTVVKHDEIVTVFGLLKRLNLGAQGYVSILQQLDSKLDGVLSECFTVKNSKTENTEKASVEMETLTSSSQQHYKVSVPYLLQLKVLISKTVYHIKQSPVCDGYMVDMFYKILQLKQAYVT